MPTCASRWPPCWRPVATFRGVSQRRGLPRQRGERAAACAVIDLRLPGMSGLDLQQKLHDEQPYLPVIVVTGHGDVATARAALRTGALDFLEKPSSRRN